MQELRLHGVDGVILVWRFETAIRWETDYLPVNGVVAVEVKAIPTPDDRPEQDRGAVTDADLAREEWDCDRYERECGYD